MKKRLIFSIACLLFLACNDKKIAASEVPQPVVAAFNAKYPNASAVEWKTETEYDKKTYEAECKFNDKQIEAVFDTAGNFIKEE